LRPAGSRVSGCRVIDIERRSEGQLRRGRTPDPRVSDPRA
jgi:hypothetical protein